jgi:Arc/MetJ family transcription regulator
MDGHGDPARQVSPKTQPNGIDGGGVRISRFMATHLVDIEEAALSAAPAELGTRTIRDTVNEALARAAASRASKVMHSLDRLSTIDLDDRSEAWR